MSRIMGELEVSPLGQFHSALNDNLYMRCKTIAELVDACSNKDLQPIFSMLVESIFGMSSQTTWGLKTISKRQQPSEFQLMGYFLAPEGPVFRMIYRLMADNYLRYDFPVACLPSNIRTLLNEGSIPYFYANKVQIHPQTRTVVGLSLNPFEFYFFHFTYFLLNPYQQRTVQIWTMGESLYSCLLEMYTNYFLPLKGQVVPPLPYHIQLSPTSPLFASPEMGSLHNYYSPSSLKSTKSPSLLRPTTLMKQASTSGNIHSALPPGIPQSHLVETWRSETVAQILIDFWLNHGNGEKKPPGFSPPQESFLPTHDHVRMVRVLIKRFHYFLNSPDTLTPLDEMKRHLLPMMQRKIYKFFCYTFDHWPLDASFRLILEAWLSYIQPWRYVDPMPIIKSSPASEETREKSVDTRWQTYVTNNLLFYTVIFNRLLPHFFRVDLTTPRNAAMLFRISKIFALTNLSIMIRSAEESLMDPHLPHLSSLSPGGLTLSSGGSYLSDATSRAKTAAIVRQQLTELEGPGFTYRPLFSRDTTAILRQLLAIIQQAKTIAENQQTAGEGANRRRGMTFWGLLKTLLGSGGNEREDTVAEVEDGHAAWVYLDNSIKNFCEIFGLQTQPEIPESPSARASTWPLGASSSPQSQLPSLPPPEQVLTPEGPVLTPRGRWQLINRRCRSDVTYQGNPDLMPICSDESAVLVRMLHHLCATLNAKYGPEIQEVYWRRSLRGQLARQILSPPALYYESADSFGSPRIQRILPPRINLRPLARYRNLTYLSVFYLLAYLWGRGILETTLLLLLISFGYCVIKALLEPWFGETPLEPVTVGDANVRVANDS